MPQHSDLAPAYQWEEGMTPRSAFESDFHDADQINQRTVTTVSLGRNNLLASPPFTKLLALFLLVIACGASAFAQSYPTKHVRFILPVAPGGGNDVIARIIGQKLSEKWGKQVIIDNRPGASGNIAAEITAHSSPDGYTVFQFNIANAIAVSTYKKLNYDPLKDFTPVTQIASSPFILVVHPSVKVTSVRDLIALAKAQPGRLNFASSGNGSASHLSMELFKRMTGTDIVQIPYNGAGPSLNDLIAGHMHATLAVPSAVIAHMKSGRVHALGVTSLKRILLAPDLPTISESGVSGFESTPWYGVVVPAKTPRPIVMKLHEGVVGVLRENDVQMRMSAQGFEVIGSSPEEFGAFMRAEIAKWGHIAKVSGVKAD